MQMYTISGVLGWDGARVGLTSKGGIRKHREQRDISMKPHFIEVKVRTAL